MAKATSGKGVASKRALRSQAAVRKRLKATSHNAFPGGVRKNRREVEQVVPRTTRT